MRNHYSNLDFLRATAVLCVAFSHLLGAIANFSAELLGGIGYFGVVVFFVHTSFVLMMSLEREYTMSPSAPLFVPFMLRRCFRIYPLSVFAVLAVFSLNLPVAGTGSSYAERSVSALFSNLLLIQNFTGSPSAPFVLWSLPYELQMYLFLPALFLFSRKMVNVIPLLLLWAGAQALAHLRLWYFPAAPDLLSYLPLFLPGIIAFKIMKPDLKPRFSCQLWPVLIGTALTAHLLLKHDAPAAAALLIGIGLPWFHQIPNGFVANASEWVAKYSFGIYLSHPISIWLAFTKLAGLSAIVKFTIFGVLFIALPIIFFHIVEEPMIRLGVRAADRFSGLNRDAEIQATSARAGSIN